MNVKVLIVHGSWHFIYETIVFGTRGSSVTIVTRLRASRSEVIILLGAKFSSILQNFQTSSGGPPNFLYNGHRRSFPGRVVMLTIHLHLVPRLRMSGAMPLLPLYAVMVWVGKPLPFAVIFEGTRRFV
jgi:hypothetical protein